MCHSGKNTQPDETGSNEYRNDVLAISYQKANISNWRDEIDKNTFIQEKN